MKFPANDPEQLKTLQNHRSLPMLNPNRRHTNAKYGKVISIRLKFLLRALPFRLMPGMIFQDARYERFLLYQTDANGSVRERVPHKNLLPDGNKGCRQFCGSAIRFLVKSHRGINWLPELQPSESDINHRQQRDTFALLCRATVLFRNPTLR